MSIVKRSPIPSLLQRSGMDPPDRKSPMALRWSRDVEVGVGAGFYTHSAPTGQAGSAREEPKFKARGTTPECSISIPPY
jgi:hypothetical protein